MAKRSFASKGFTPVGVADTTNFTDAGYMALQGGSSTQRTFIREVNIQGLALASAPTPLVFGRDSTVGVTLTALAAPNSDGPLAPSTAALAAPAVPFVASTTKPKRDVAAAVLSLGVNAFGGIMYWVAAQSEEWQMYGATASFGESSLSCYTGGTPGLVLAHIIYETE
jgi:hypothetical protein